MDRGKGYFLCMYFSISHLIEGHFDIKITLPISPFVLLEYFPLPCPLSPHHHDFHSVGSVSEQNLAHLAGIS